MENVVLIEEILMLAKAYAAMGWAVQAQLDQAIEGDQDGLNPNAVAMMKEWLDLCAKSGVEDAHEVLA